MALKDRKNLGGRPRTKPIVEGDRVPIGLRVTPELKDKLATVADLNGRSQSQEIEFRLERSFDRLELLQDALTLKHGGYGAVLLQAIGEAMSIAGRSAAICADPIASMKGPWTENPYAYQEAVNAIVAVLEAMRPKGKITLPPAGKRALFSGSPHSTIGESVAADVMAALDGKSEDKILSAWAARVQPLRARGKEPRE